MVKYSIYNENSLCFIVILISLFFVRIRKTWCWLENLKIFKEFCKENLNINLVFTSFKIIYFSYKVRIPDYLKSFLVYKCTCTRCGNSCISETCRHFKTMIEKHKKMITGFIFLNIYIPPQHAFRSYNFQIIYKIYS